MDFNISCCFYSIIRWESRKSFTYNSKAELLGDSTYSPNRQPNCDRRRAGRALWVSFPRCPVWQGWLQPLPACSKHFSAGWPLPYEAPSGRCNGIQVRNQVDSASKFHWQSKSAIRHFGECDTFLELQHATGGQAGEAESGRASVSAQGSSSSKRPYDRI